MQFKKIAFFIISTTILFTGCDSKNEENKEIKKEIIQKKEKTYKLITQDSTELNVKKIEYGLEFTEFKDKAILLNFWATWCPPCKAEIPHLNNLQNKYKDSFEIVAVNLGKRDGTMTSEADLKAFIDEHKINYTVTNSVVNFDIADAMGGIRSIPTMFLLGKDGKVVQKYVGLVPEEMIETDIKRVLGK